MLAELREERQRIEEAILVFERLASGSGKRRGRPPAWMAQAEERSASAESAGDAAPVRRKRGRPKKVA